MRASAWPTAAVLDLRLVSEEVLANIAKHAFSDDREHEIELSLSIGDAESSLEFRDQGRPFDPTTAPLPDTHAPPEGREPGGLGLLLLRSLVDAVRYRREGSQNVLRIVKRRDAPS